MAASSASISNTFEILVLGAANVGKTSIIKRFLFNQCPLQHDATIEDTFLKKVSINGSPPLIVKFVDTSGSFNFPAMRRLAVSKASAFLLVFSVTDADSLEYLNDLVTQVREERSELTGRDNHYAPLLILANKSELEVGKWAMNKENVRGWIMEHDIPVSALFYTSAKLDMKQWAPESVWNTFAYLWKLECEKIKSESVLEEFSLLEKCEGILNPESSEERSPSSLSASPRPSITLSLAKSRSPSTILKKPFYTGKRRSSAFAILTNGPSSLAASLPRTSLEYDVPSTVVESDSPCECPSTRRASSILPSITTSRRKSSITSLAGSALNNLFSRRPECKYSVDCKENVLNLNCNIS